MEKKKNIIIISLVIIIIILITLVFLLAKNVISFNINKPKINDNLVNQHVEENKKKDNDDNSVTNSDNSKDVKQDDSLNNNLNNSGDTIKISTNMTNNQVFELWNKIKGNWAKVSNSNDFCVGSALEINTYVKRIKFNSDGIAVWSITSFEKIDDNKYRINLLFPVNLNNEMSGDIKANTSDIVLDISNIDRKILRVVYDDNYTDYEYVGENKFTNSNHQYIDGGFTQDYYCEWYMNKNR